MQRRVDMAFREFEDARGAWWRVWDTVPTPMPGLGDLRNGWLTFDNGMERRRLAPVPDHWDDLPADRLLLLLQMASPTREVARRRA